MQVNVVTMSLMWTEKVLLNCIRSFEYVCLHVNYVFFPFINERPKLCSVIDALHQWYATKLTDNIQTRQMQKRPENVSFYI